MQSVYLHGSPRSTNDLPDEDFSYGDAQGTFGVGPIDIDATIGRVSRTTNEKLGNCVGGGDCFKQIIEKHGYFGIWPLPGSGESLGQMPGGDLQDWGFHPSGIIPLDPNSSGVDPWGQPTIDLTQPMCVSATPNCCNTCPTEQDTRHEDNRPDPNICACIYKYDHQEPENDKTKEIQCSGIASTETGMDTGSSFAPPPVVKETWAYDSTKRNWASHSYNKFDATTGDPLWDQRGYYERTMTFNDADQPTQEVITRSEFVGGVWQESSMVETNEIRFDKRGNLWADGKRVFNYDAYNRLTGVWHRSTAPNAHIEDKGNPIAAFTYDGYGHRLTARYNSTKPETNQATLDDDPVDIYSYDHLWRVRTVTQATYHSSTSSWSSFVREQWFYRNSEDPTQYKIGSDAPVMRRIDVNGDGIFEKTQNFVTDRQGSVVAVLGDAILVDVNNEALGNKPGPMIARVRYDTYGVPTICDPADIDRDGVVDVADALLYVVYWQKWMQNDGNSPRYKEIADFTRDGVVDPTGSGSGPDAVNNTDYAKFLERYYAATLPNAKTAAEEVGNLPLYAGYWWDAQLEMYHVRHRVYRPEWGKWIQRDPLGYAAGWNLYEYVGGEPWRAIDPEGLDDYVWENARGYKNGMPGTYHHLYRRKNHKFLGVVLLKYYEETLVKTTFTSDDGEGVDSGGQTEYQRLATAQISGAAATVESVTHSGVIVILFIIPGPEDAVIAGFMARRQIVHFIREGGKLIGITAKGQKKILSEAEQALAEKALKNGHLVEFKDFTRDNFRENLETAIGKKLDSCEDAHHMVAHSDSRASRAREILQKYDIDVNDPRVNGVPWNNKHHHYMHDAVPDEYYEWVDEQLEHATSKEDVLEILDRIRDTILRGETPWEP